MADLTRQLVGRGFMLDTTQDLMNTGDLRLEILGNMHVPLHCCGLLRPAGETTLHHRPFSARLGAVIGTILAMGSVGIKPRPYRRARHHCLESAQVAKHTESASASRVKDRSFFSSSASMPKTDCPGHAEPKAAMICLCRSFPLRGDNRQDCAPHGD